MKPALAYLRVSTLDQAENGISLDAQRDRIESWAKGNGLDLLAVHQDAGISGKGMHNRPGFQAALKDACHHKCPLIVYSLSRATRSIADACKIVDRLTKSGGTLVSLTEAIDGTTAMGRCMLNLMTVLNQFEREQIGERTREAMKHLRKQDRRISPQEPFGHVLNGDGRTLEPHAGEQAAIRIMRDLRGQGFSLRQIASHLESRNIRPKTGKTWTAESVSSILKRAAKLAA